MNASRSRKDEFMMDLGESVIAKVGIPWDQFDIAAFIDIIPDGDDMADSCMTDEAFRARLRGEGLRHEARCEYEIKSDIAEAALEALGCELRDIDLDALKKALGEGAHGPDGRSVATKRYAEGEDIAIVKLRDSVP